MNLSEAIVLYLKHYPGTNEEEFRSKFNVDADYYAVRALLDETIKIQLEWGDKSLIEIGEEVQAVLHNRHPELSAQALEALARYYTYLVK